MAATDPGPKKPAQTVAGLVTYDGVTHKVTASAAMKQNTANALITQSVTGLDS